MPDDHPISRRKFIRSASAAAGFATIPFNSARGPAELLLSDEGVHCCHNVNHRSKPAVADWLLGHLGANS